MPLNDLKTLAEPTPKSTRRRCILIYRLHNYYKYMYALEQTLHLTMHVEKLFKDKTFHCFINYYGIDTNHPVQQIIKISVQDFGH